MHSTGPREKAAPHEKAKKAEGFETLWQRPKGGSEKDEIPAILSQATRSATIPMSLAWGEFSIATLHVKKLNFVVKKPRG